MRRSRDSYMMALAQEAAKQTTCIRRGVGCVLTDAKGFILAVAYNGVATGMSHCNAQVIFADGTQYSGVCKDSSKAGCEAVHAEQNALLQCHDVQKVHTAYVTRSPCRNCTKLLLNTSCTEVVYADTHSDITAKLLWEKSGRKWTHLPDNQGELF